MHIRSVKQALVLVLVVCLGTVLPAWAQSLNTGTIAGTVTDPTGAVVNAATVTLVDSSIKTTHTVTSNSAGRYIFVDVSPGNYDVTFTKQGFSTAKTQITVEVGLATTVNMSLQVGGSSTVVEVTAVGNELQTMNATVGNTVDSKMLDALPSIGRDVSTFVELQPGVSPEGSVAGTVNDQTYFSLDGGNNTNDMDGNMSTYTSTYAGDPSGGIASQGNTSFYLVGNPTGVMPTPQDSVEEFKVNTAGQTADFNSSSGAEVKVVTKRGTNSWHGTGYEYYLDNSFSSNSYQNNYTDNGAFAPTPIPSFHYSRFGFAVGGPAIPKELLGGKTYAFFNYEGFRWPDQSTTIHRDVPSPGLISGMITDPVTGTVYNLATLDPRGIGLNPIVQQIWKTYEPASNGSCINPLCDGTNVLGYTANVTLPEKNNIAVTRLDHDFAKNWHFMSSWRYFKFPTNAIDYQIDIGGGLPGDKLGVPTSHSGNPQQAWYLVGGLTTNISPNVTNDFHYSFLRNWWQWNRAGDVPQNLGSTGTLGGALEIFSGEGNGFTDDLAPYNVNTQQTRTRFWDGHDQMFRDDVSLLKGNHLLQFGGQYQHNFNYHERTDNGGGINYQPVYQLGSSSGSGLASDLSICTNTPDIPNCSALTAAMLGIVSISQIAYTRSGADLTLNPPLTPAFDQVKIPYYNVYVTDSWHMKKTFTFTYGLGWALEMPPVEANGKQVELVDSANQLVDFNTYINTRKAQALQGNVFNPELGFTLVGNTGRKYPYNPYYGEFSPRVAAAWNPHFDPDTFAAKVFGSDSSVLRGGYGRQYGRLNGVDLVLVPLLGTGLIQATQCFNPITTGACAGPGVATLSNAFRVGIDSASGPGTINAPLAVPSVTLPQPDFPGYNAIAAGAGEALDPNFRPTAVDSFDLTLQRQVARKVTLELGYIGRRIEHEYLPININAVPYMMTVGGQTFANAYKNLVLQYCGGVQGLAGGGCAGASKTGPTTVTPQPFFEAALAGTGYCAPGTCTQTVANNEGVVTTANPNATGNLSQQLVWSLWSDLDNGDFNFPRTMQNTPIANSPFGASGSFSSGVAINTSVGHGNYNGGFVSLKMADWRGLTAQSNFTYSKALGTAALIQATSGFTADDPYNINEMYGPQFYNRKFLFNTFLVYTPPYYTGQSGVIGRILGGWTISPVFASGSGQPNQVWPSNFTTQSFGEGDSGDNYLSTETAVPIGPLPAHSHAYYGRTSGALPVNLFSNPAAAFSNYRNPVLGLDTRDTSFVNGVPFWNVDLSIRKNVRVAESVALEFQTIFVNVFNHNQWLDPTAPFGLFEGAPPSGTFGALQGSAQENAGGNRAIQFGARVRF